MKFNVKWIGQGGFVLTLGDRKVCIDPYLSNSVKSGNDFDRIVPVPVEPQNLQVDMILCTHDHIDHVDEETLKYTNHENIRYAGPESCVEHFRAIGIPERNISTLNRGQAINLGDISIKGVYAKHTPDSIGIVIEYVGKSLYFVGDSLYDEELYKVKELKPDVLVTCINGKLGNMNYEEAAELAKALEVRTAVPCHYGMFKENTEDPKNFKEALKGSTIKYFEVDFNKEYAVEDILNC